uniref:Iron hydrogenase large subunit C-terminal domain-containing protein n=2 Tax=Rhodosorus marinus TaxID=101924 RepID=A0A7S3EP33_9RHOD|mmetsp:Transcript_6949/g.30410  ORF Transcript_6949/g.30410 Transcript_6949/m.30410 type:complete len:461 (+) Transcript_6949:106-1488(+)
MGQGTVKLTDLNDFLRPSDACILPVGGGMQAKSEPKPGSFASPMYGKQSEEQAKIARVTLSDCITCSGCVTSAETILLDSTEALRAFESGCSDKSRFAVVGLSQQAVASVAEKYGLGLVATYEKLCTILKELGASRVYDVSLARRICLLEHLAEVFTKIEKQQSIITSACPGFVSYVEKKQGPEVIGKLSNVKSPQAILATLAKRLLPSATEVPQGREVWVASVMPCHDKKLEAARPELEYNENPEVDSVITSDELDSIIIKSFSPLSTVRRTPLDEDFGDDHGPLGSVCLGELVGSGGYLEFTVRAVAEKYFGYKLPERVQFRTIGRGRDFKEYILQGPGQGEKSMKFAAAYGFKNVQKIMRSISAGRCQYQYIEMMSCPGGCNNGGGQIGGDVRDRSLLEKVEAVYKQGSVIDDLKDCKGVQIVYDLIGAEPGSDKARKFFHTTFESRGEVPLASLEW